MCCELMASSAENLGRRRRHGTVCDLPLDKISPDIQVAALQNVDRDARVFKRMVYAIVGSSKASRRTLSLSKPIFSAILVENGRQRQPGDIMTASSRAIGAGGILVLLFAALAADGSSLGRS